MTRIVKVYFKSSATEILQETVRGRVECLRNYLKRRLDAKRVVEVHQRAAEVATSLAFHVMRHDRATVRAIRPEPNEGNLPDAATLQDEYQIILAP